MYTLSITTVRCSYVVREPRHMRWHIIFHFDVNSVRRQKEHPAFVLEQTFESMTRFEIRCAFKSRTIF